MFCMLHPATCGCLCLAYHRWVRAAGLGGSPVGGMPAGRVFPASCSVGLFAWVHGHGKERGRTGLFFFQARSAPSQWCGRCFPGAAMPTLHVHGLAGACAATKEPCTPHPALQAGVFSSFVCRPLLSSLTSRLRQRRVRGVHEQCKLLLLQCVLCDMRSLSSALHRLCYCTIFWGAGNVGRPAKSASGSVHRQQQQLGQCCVVLC